MTRSSARTRRSVESTPPAMANPWHLRWYGRLVLLLLSAGLLTLAFAPLNQFYLAWVGLVPWLWVVKTSRSQGAAFLWSWIGGTVFFIANMWWLAYVTVPGMIALLVYLGLYWGFAALIIRGTRMLEPGTVRPASRAIAGVLLIAATWTTFEYVRGNLMTGLPWLYLGHTQSPFLLMCQIADFAGVYGVTFCVVAINAVIVLALLNRARIGSLIPAMGMVVLMVAATIGYGVLRHSETARVTSPGPTIVVVQPNYPQDNTSGEKSGSEEEHFQFHLKTTRDAVETAGGADLAVWSETMMPGLNASYRQDVQGLQTHDIEDIGKYLDAMYGRLVALVRGTQTNVLTGGVFCDQKVMKRNGAVNFADRRNCAYLFERPTGEMSPLRYDKIHLVPFGEFIPFKKSIPWLYGMFLKMSPYDFDYTLTPGNDNALTVFTIHAQKTGKPVRFVVPICFEDIDSRLVARMVNSNGTKRADLLVNLTNDGWFKANENPQHLQAALFRSIENRVPTARSVNTGVSGFVDSYGRVLKTIPQDAEGAASLELPLDSRYTWYTRIGDVFALLCIASTVAVSLPALGKWWTARRRRKQAAA